MKIDGRHINTNLRRDNGPRPFRPENMATKLSFNPKSNTFSLRIDDTVNPEFWIEVIIPESEVEGAKSEVKGREK